MAPETLAGIHSDPFASYFSDCNPNTPPKVLTTTSPKAAEVTYKLSEELVDVFPVAESVRKKGRGFEIGGNAGWGNAVVLNEDVKKPSEWFVACGCVSRRNHVNSPPRWPDYVLQADIDRTLRPHLLESVQDAVR